MKKNQIIGIFFIVLAIFLFTLTYLPSEFLDLINQDVIISVIFFAVAFYNLVFKNYGWMSIFLWLNYAYHYSWLEQHLLLPNPMIMLVIICLIYFGVKQFRKPLNYKKYNRAHFSSNEYHPDFIDKSYDINAQFSAGKYYFDKTIIKNNITEFNCDVTFSEITLYVPKNIYFVNHLDIKFGECNFVGANDINQIQVVLKGKIYFGEINIIYV